MGVTANVLVNTMTIAAAYSFPPTYNGPVNVPLGRGDSAGSTELATLHGASALKLPAVIGTLEPHEHQDTVAQTEQIRRTRRDAVIGPKEMRAEKIEMQIDGKARATADSTTWERDWIPEDCNVSRQRQISSRRNTDSVVSRGFLHRPGRCGSCQCNSPPQ